MVPAFKQTTIFQIFVPFNCHNLTVMLSIRLSIFGSDFKTLLNSSTNQKTTKAFIQEILVRAYYISDTMQNGDNTVIKNSNFISILAKLID